MANMEKLNSTLRYIRTHMDLWDQTHWFEALDGAGEFTSRQIVDMILEDPYEPACGVTGCMAGLACFQNGYVPIFRVQGEGDWAMVQPGEMVAKRDPQTGKLGEHSTTKDAAAAIFDIDYTTASRLFDSDNSFEDLQAMVAHIGEHGTLQTYNTRQCSCGVEGCVVDVDDEGYDDDSYEDDYDDQDSIF
jgi:hypothetical protein